MADRKNEEQAPRRTINQKRITERTVAELIGLVRGVLADGEINQAEAEFLELWMQINADYVDHWQCAPLYTRLQEMLQDGKLDHDEQRELLDTLSSFASPAIRADGRFAPNESLCDDVEPDQVDLIDKRVCFTGKFVTDSRTRLAERCNEHLIKVVNSVTTRLDYLVIGSCGSPEWLHSTHGKKIQNARELQAGGARLMVIPERVFIIALQAIEQRFAAQ